MALGNIALALIAIFIPPVPVVLKRGCGGQMLLNILLIFLAWIPAVLHAWWIIVEDKDKRGRSQSRSSSRSRPMKIPKQGYPPPPAQHGYRPQQPMYAPAQGHGYAAGPKRF